MSITAPRPLTGADIVSALTAGAGTMLPTGVLPAVPALAPVATSGSYADLSGKPNIPPAANPATANALGLVKAGTGLLAAPDGTFSVDSAAPTVLSGPPLGTDQVVIVRGTTTYYVPVSALMGATPATATAATLAGTPTTGTAGTALAATTVTTTPSGASAFMALYTGTADVGSRVAVASGGTFAPTPAAVGSFTVRAYAAATGGVPLQESGVVTVAAAGVFPLTFAGAAGALTGNQVVSAWNGGDVTQFVRDGSGNLVFPTASSTRGVFAAAGAVSANGTLSATLAAGSNRTIEFVFRASGSGATANGYLITGSPYTDGTISFDLYKSVNGAFTNMAYGAIVVDPGGQNLSVVINGSTFTVKIGTATMATFSDGTYAAGGLVGVGIGTSGSSATKVSQVSYQ